LGDFELSVTVDKIRYRNGNSHAAYFRSDYAGQFIDTSALAGTGVELLSCGIFDVDGFGVDSIFGRRPTDECRWQDGDGLMGSVTLD